MTPCWFCRVVLKPIKMCVLNSQTNNKMKKLDQKHDSLNFLRIMLKSSLYFLVLRDHGAHSRDTFT